MAKLSELQVDNQGWSENTDNTVEISSEFADTVIVAKDVLIGDAKNQE